VRVGGIRVAQTLAYELQKKPSDAAMKLKLLRWARKPTNTPKKREKERLRRKIRNRYLLPPARSPFAPVVPDGAQLQSLTRLVLKAAAAKAAEDAKWADSDPKVRNTATCWPCLLCFLLGCSCNAIQALAKEAKRKQEEEKSRLEEMKRQEKKALEEADAARFKGKESKEPKTLTQFQIYEQKMQREAHARAMARQEVPACLLRHFFPLTPHAGVRTRA
jgi:hypothetical protein